MTTELPETKREGADVIEVNTQEKDFFSKSLKKVRELEAAGKLDPDLNLTVVDTTEFLPVGH